VINFVFLVESNLLPFVELVFYFVCLLGYDKVVLMNFQFLDLALEMVFDLMNWVLFKFAPFCINQLYDCLAYK
jgi:hypothetical protein